MTEYRSLNGYGNNRTHPDWGRSGTRLLRHPGLAGYTADGHTAAGADRPNPRDVSNIVCAQIGAGKKSAAGLSDFAWAWGQLLDHELDLTVAAFPRESLDIVVQAGSHPRLPDRDGLIEFSRSRFDPSSGSSALDPREQINEQTSFIDGSNIYGGSAERVAVLRAHEDGKLKSSDLKNHKRTLLPKNTFDLDNDHGPGRPGIKASDFFVAGDIRCNEHAVLTCLHTLLLREHNRLCDELKSSLKNELSNLSPAIQDERLFQEAKRRVVAEVQVITFQEFLPAILGDNAIGEYTGYNANINPSISNLFAHSAYRLGHSMVSPKIQRIPQSGNRSELELEKAFWAPNLVDSAFVDEIINGLWQQTMQEIDTQTVDGLRNHLFASQIVGQPDRILDLAALNIQRGRDHGFPSYNQCRIALGLTPRNRIDEITCDIETRGRLRHAYDNNVQLIDPWIGGLAETHVEGAQVGELIYHVVREQFSRLRDGDRFWFEAADAGFTDQQIADLKNNTTLARLIRDNTNVNPTTEDVFHCD